MPGFVHRPGFLTPYFFGIDSTFSVTKMGKYITSFYVGEREEHLYHRSDYVSFPKFEYASRSKDKERQAYYTSSGEGRLVAVAEVKLGSNWYNTDFKVNGVIIGTARTQVKYTKFDTSYYVNDVLVGSSHTEGNGGLYETTYKDATGKVVGESYMFSGSMELTATHEFPEVNERIKIAQLSKPKIISEVKSSPLENQTAAHGRVEDAKEENKRKSKKIEPMRMFAENIEQQSQSKTENKRRHCVIL